MAVPKRKVSRSRRDMRSANKFLTPAIFSMCKNEECKSAVMPHVVCRKCGFYKGKLILDIKTKKLS